MLDNEQPVRFHGLSTTGSGLIKAMDRTMLSVSLQESGDNNLFSVCEHLTGYFDYHGTTYAFDSIIRDVNNNQIRIDTPAILLRSLQRKYVRVRKPQDVKVVFRLANEEIQMDYPVCPEYVSVDEVDGSAFPSRTNLPDLIASFRDQIKDKCSNNTIVMFRTKKPTLFEEDLISKTGKVLYIPSTTSSLPKNDPYPEGRIITESIEETFEEPDYFVTGSHFEKLLQDKKSRGITSEIWCPIIYFQYVVGYVYAVSSGTDSFDISMVDYMWDFARVLAFSLKSTGYFDSSSSAPKNPPSHHAQIIDMSPGGMLISLPKDEIRMPIREGSFFSVEISLGSRKASCNAKVCRRYEEASSVCYATNFINLSPDSLMSLYEFLYRRPFAQDDPVVYEKQKIANLQKT